MEPWSLARYARPYLAASVSLVDGRVMLESDAATHVVHARGPDARRLYGVLRRMQDPDDALWIDFRTNATTARPWRGLVGELDRLALLGEAARIVPAKVDLEARLRRTVEEVLAAARDHPHAALRMLPLAARALNEDGQTSFTAVRGNFFLELLSLEAIYWRQVAPRSLESARAVLAQVAAAVPGSAPLPNSTPEAATSDLYDDDALDAHLELLSFVLTSAMTDDATRMLSGDVRVDAESSGTNLGLRAERQVGAALGRLGPPTFIALLDDDAVNQALVQAYLVEDFHMTRRYVEAITPLLARRTREQLRGLLFRYYAEEVGHEQFALRTALCCGLTEAAVLHRRLGALRAAFMDVLSALAYQEPISLFVCLLITEGLPSVDQPILDLVSRLPRFAQCFAEVGREHAELNADLHHQTLPRLLLSEVPRVTVRDQELAFARLSFMLELNHRAWESLSRSVAPSRS